MNLTSVNLSDQVSKPGAMAHMSARTFHARDGFAMSVQDGALLIANRGKTVAVPLAKLVSAELHDDAIVNGTPLESVSFGMLPNQTQVRVTDAKAINLLGARSAFTVKEGYRITMQDGLVIVEHPTTKKRYCGSFANAIQVVPSLDFDVTIGEDGNE